MNSGIIPDLLMIAQTHFGLKELEVANLKLYLDENKTDDFQKLFPLHRISSQIVFFELIEHIIDRLKVFFTSQELDNISLANDESFTGFFISCPNDPIKLLLPAELLLALPTRDVNITSIVARKFGKPVGSILKERGVVEQKRRSNTELEHDYSELIFKQAVPMMEQALELGKLKKIEYKFIKDFINTINLVRSIYIGGNKDAITKGIGSTISIAKMVSVTEISSTVANLAKSGMLPSDQVNDFEQALLCREPVKCKACGNSFYNTRRTQTFCKECSNSAAYHRNIRASKGSKQHGGKRPGAGRPKKKS